MLGNSVVAVQFHFSLQWSIVRIEETQHVLAHDDNAWPVDAVASPSPTYHFVERFNVSFSQILPDREGAMTSRTAESIDRMLFIPTAESVTSTTTTTTYSFLTFDPT